jgi:hypothetical protein
VDCTGDPGGGSVGLDDGDCLWDSCGDGSQSGDPDPSDECTDSSCDDWTHLGGSDASTPPAGVSPVTVDETALDNAGSGGDWNHMSFRPADGTIFESFNTGSVYQVIGGVPTLDCSAAQTFLYVDQFALNAAGSGGFYNHLAPLPSPPPPPCPPPPPSGGGPQL